MRKHGRRKLWAEGAMSPATGRSPPTEPLGAVLDLIDSPPVFEALTDDVPRTRLDQLVEDLANRLSHVHYLVRDQGVTPIS
jgi:hypothetical protein